MSPIAHPSPHAHWAFEERGLILTDMGMGIVTQRRVADLVLPTGELALGRPAPPGNVPGLSHPRVAPGTYPVWVSDFAGEEKGRALLFVRVDLRVDRAGPPAEPTTWESPGAFASDSGDGCLYDRSLTPQVAEWPDRAAWLAVRDATLEDGPGGLTLDPASGANAILWKTAIGRFPYGLGRDTTGAPSCLLVAVYTGG